MDNEGIIAHELAQGPGNGQTQARATVAGLGATGIMLDTYHSWWDPDFGRAVDSLQEASGDLLEGLVLDLRDNPGGVLDAAVNVADLFLDAGVIVTAEGRSLNRRVDITIRPNT